MDMVLQGDKMAYFPMFVDMTERECLIVGGGNVAYRKVIVMLDFGAKVTVVAEDICEALRTLIADDRANKGSFGLDAANKEGSQVESDAADRITIIKRSLIKKTVTAWKWLSLPLMTML